MAMSSAICLPAGVDGVAALLVESLDSALAPNLAHFAVLIARELENNMLVELRVSWCRIRTNRSIVATNACCSGFAATVQ